MSEELSAKIKVDFGFLRFKSKEMENDTWVCQIYNSYYRENENGPQIISRNAMVRQRDTVKKLMSPADLKETLLDPDMIGLRLPRTDLDHLRDFSKCAIAFALNSIILFPGRVTLQSNKDKEFYLQDKFVSKLEHFM